MRGAKDLSLKVDFPSFATIEKPETAILMLADALESVIRSLKKPTQEEIEAKVNKIFTERLNDGQLSDSPLTLKDIKIIAMTFNKVLRGMQR